MIDIYLTSLSTALAWTILHSLWQLTLIALFVKGLSTLFRKSSTWQNRIQVVGMFAMLIVCALSFQQKFTSEIGQSKINVNSVFNNIQTNHKLQHTNEKLKQNDLTLTASAEKSHWSSNIKIWMDQNAFWLSILWCVGVILLSFRFVGSWLYLKKIKKYKADPTPDHWTHRVQQLCLQYQISQKVKLRFTDKVDEPLSFGWLKPIILFPIGLVNNLTPEQVELILLHELAHIQRQDYLVNLIQNSIEILLFYHPAAWWISKQISISREHCCDDWVLNREDKRMAYAQALTQVQQFNFFTTNNLAMSAKGNTGSFTTRIKRLFGSGQQVTIWNSIAPLFLIGTLVLFSTNYKAIAQEKLNKDPEVTQILKDFNQSIDHIPFKDKEQVLKTYIYHRPVDNTGKELHVQLELVRGTDSFESKKIRLSFPYGDRPIVLYGDAKIPTNDLGVLYFITKDEFADLEIWTTEKALKELGPKAAEAGVFQIKIKEIDKKKNEAIKAKAIALANEPAEKGLTGSFTLEEQIDDSGRLLKTQIDIYPDPNDKEKQLIKLTFLDQEKGFIVVNEDGPISGGNSIVLSTKKKIVSLGAMNRIEAYSKYGQEAADVGVFQIKTEQTTEALIEKEIEEELEEERYVPEIPAEIFEELPINEAEILEDGIMMDTENEITKITGTGILEFEHKKDPNDKSMELRGAFSIKGGAANFFKTMEKGPLLFANNELMDQQKIKAFEAELKYDSIFYYNPKDAVERFGEIGKKGVYLLFHEMSDNQKSLNSVQMEKVFSQYSSYLESFVKNKQAVVTNFKVYPTSFKERTTIDFSVNLAQHIKIQVFSLEGKLIDTLHDQQFEQGNHSLNWNSGNLATGMYIVRLNYEDQSISKRIIKQ